jgi:hypothetical protein
MKKVFVACLCFFIVSLAFAQSQSSSGHPATTAAPAQKSERLSADTPETTVLGKQSPQYGRQLGTWPENLASGEARIRRQPSYCRVPRSRLRGNLRTANMQGCFFQSPRVREAALGPGEQSVCAVSRSYSATSCSAIPRSVLQIDRAANVRGKLCPLL